jgi:dihydropteroate synthase
MLFRFADRSWTFPGIRVMGILNVTPDSFFDGGRFLDPAAALDRARAMAEAGADMIDVGGESTRPMASPVSVQEELDRVIPAIRAIAQGLRVPISIDTTKSEVARQAIAEGASVINDVSGGRADPALAGVAASTGAGLILMHSRGDSRTMQTLTHYASVTRDVISELSDSILAAEAAGVSREQIVIDPGFGFAKTAGQNLVLLRELEALRSLGRPVLAGVSRKSFLGALIDRPPEGRLAASLSAQFLAMLRGCDIIRTHDVRETVETVKILNAILAARPSAVR